MRGRPRLTTIAELAENLFVASVAAGNYAPSVVTEEDARDCVDAATMFVDTVMRELGDE